MAILYPKPATQTLAALTDCERFVVDWFMSRLSDDWEVFVRPHLNGLKPDLATFHPLHGLGLFDVIGGARDLGDLGETEHPLDRQYRMRRFAISLLAPDFAGAVAEDFRVGNRVTVGIIDPMRTTREIYESWRQEMTGRSYLFSGAQFFYPIKGRDALGRSLSGVYPRWDSEKKPLSAVQAIQFRSWLEAPEPARISLMMTPEQRHLAQRQSDVSFCRIRGAAGSGKSQVLAARSMELAARGKNVLVLTYNITAWHPLRDLALRWPVNGRTFAHQVTWLHFHEWCSQRIAEANRRSTFLDRTAQQGSNQDWGNPGPNHYFDVVLPQRCAEALQKRKILYDAILVDEAHDFLALWWDVLRIALKPGGEAMIAADSTQDLFHPGNRWVDTAMVGSGFLDSWIEQPFKTGYRLPPQLIPHVQRFARFHQPLLGSRASPPEQWPTQEQYDPFSTKWVHVGELGDLVRTAVKALKDERRSAQRQGIGDSQIAVLCQRRDLGRKLRDALKAERIPVQHLFGDDISDTRLLKIAFSQQDPRVKLAPLKSFRGWQARKVILVIQHAEKEEDFKEIYVGLTRVKTGGLGASLTVISQPETLLDFSLGWPNFVDARPLEKRESPAAQRPGSHTRQSVASEMRLQKEQTEPPDPMDDIPF